MGWTDELEISFGCLLNDLIQTGGRVARGNLLPETAVKYCLSRGKGPTEISNDHVATPCTLIAVMLLEACRHNMDELVDEHLKVMDHRYLSLYVPSGYDRFGVRTMSDGDNHTRAIGQDVFTCDDFRKQFLPVIEQHLREDSFPKSGLEAEMAISASLCYPDRLPLFLCP